MAKKDYYIVSKNVQKIMRGGFTNFLNYGLLKKVTSKLKNCKYEIYKPYNEAEKVIIYTDEIPKIRLFEIISSEKLKHSEIMGSLFGLNIEDEMFGDIVIFDNQYYIMIMDSIFDLVKNEYNMVGSKKVSLNEVSFDVLNNYKRKYKKIELIVSSLRIDNVISKLIFSSREDIKKKLVNDEIFINYEVCHKPNYNLNEGDIFSIRKCGKFKFGGVIKNTKNDKILVKIYKYIE